MTRFDNLEYASFNRRIISGTIDVLLVALILTPVTKLLDFLFYNGKGLATLIGEFFQARDNVVNSEELWDFLSVNNILIKYLVGQTILLTLIGLFFIGFWFYKGQTPGKMITRSRIIDSRFGIRPTLKQCVVRFLSYILSTLTLCLGFIMASFTKRKQGMHDMIAGTVVVIDKKLSASSADE